MSARKWGETFLKSGLPLEHLTLTVLSGLGWGCEPRWEYHRRNRDGALRYFEIDLLAHAEFDEPDNDLILLTECKYHDQQRFWFFLPCSTEDHKAQYGAMSAGQDPEADEEVLHYGPYDPLVHPKNHSLIELAPQSVWGITLSESGERQDNALVTALEQLSYAWVPFCLDRAYHFCASWPTAVIPVVVTSARLFRMKPEVQRIETIRHAGSPTDIADELQWTWCYYPASGDLLDHNHAAIDLWKATHKGLRWPGLADRLAHLWTGLHWALVVNIDSLADATSAVRRSFAGLDKNFSRNGRLEALMNRLASQRRQAGGKPQR